jgi:hypothetical protein
MQGKSKIGVRIRAVLVFFFVAVAVAGAASLHASVLLFFCHIQPLYYRSEEDFEYIMAGQR